MNKKLLILLLSSLLLVSCSKKNQEITSNTSDKEIAENLYAEAVQALQDGDAFYAAKKFKEVESLMPQYIWASKASLMASYAEYSRNAYSNAIFGLERHINN